MSCITKLIEDNAAVIAKRLTWTVCIFQEAFDKVTYQRELVIVRKSDPEYNKFYRTGKCILPLINKKFCHGNHKP